MDKRWHVGVLGLGRLPIGWRLVIAFGGINLLVFTMMAVTVLSLGQAEQALAAGGATTVAEQALVHTRWWVLGLGRPSAHWPWWPGSACGAASCSRWARPS